MSAQKGKDLLIKIDLDGSGEFETIAGLRATRLSFNAEAVDTTNLDSDGWREVLAGAGVRSASLTGSGVFKDARTDARTQQVFFEGSTPNFQVIVPDFGIVEGAFHINSIEYAGTHDGEATYELSMSSAGVLTFTAI